MIKSYPKYGRTAVFGTISGNVCNVIFDSTGKRAISGFMDRVTVWNIRLNKVVSWWHDPENQARATFIEARPNGMHYAVGYHDGSIRIFDIDGTKIMDGFRGHKSSICCLKFSACNDYLASGSKDGDIVVWDIIGERGITRLMGHKQAITGLQFVDIDTRGRCLISSSKDGLLKIWDCGQRHCYKTLVEHEHEIGGFAMDSSQKIVITGSIDGFLRLFRFNLDRELEFYTKVPRMGRDRVTGCMFIGECLLVLSDRTVEMYRIFTESEMAKKMKRRKKKGKAVAPGDEVEGFQILKHRDKMRSFSVNAKQDCMIVGTFSNAIQIYTLPRSKTDEFQLGKEIDIHGHRREIRHVQVSRNGQLLVSTSSESIKIWNLSSQQCIRTLEAFIGEKNLSPVSASFVSQDQNVVVSSKEGIVLLIQISTDTVLCSVEAHQGLVSSVWIDPLGIEIMTGGIDKTVKFWKLDPGPELCLGQTLEMNEGVVSCKCSPNGRYVAIGLLDNTIKVFHRDSLKFYLSLYGHKLPVTCLDISDDENLLISGSADKNIKIWGLRFGDCHKSLFAHEAGISSLAFIPQTHCFFSASQDSFVKYWDGDKFVMIARLGVDVEGCSSISIDSTGSVLVGGFRNRAIAVWEHEDEPVFVEEERENELDALVDEALIKEQQHGEVVDVGTDGLGPIFAASHLKTAERVFELIECVMEEINTCSEIEHKKESMGISLAPFQRHPLLLGLAQGESVPAALILLRYLEKIPSVDIESIMLLLPTSSLHGLIQCLKTWYDNRWDIVLSVRLTTLVLRVLGPSIRFVPDIRPILTHIKIQGGQELCRTKNILGRNLFSLINFTGNFAGGTASEF